MNRSDLQNLSRIRQGEANALLSACCWHGAYYLAGYAVECALKACIARNTRRFDFPDKDLAQKVFTHHLESLIKLAGVFVELQSDWAQNRSLETNWMLVKDWNETFRYDPTLTEADARELYTACTDHRSGILHWIRRRW